MAYTIMGLHEYMPDSGTVFFDKKDITHASITERTLVGTPLHHAGIDEQFVVANQLLATEHGRNDYFRNRLSPRPSFGDDPALRH